MAVRIGRMQRTANAEAFGLASCVFKQRDAPELVKRQKPSVVRVQHERLRLT